MTLHFSGALGLSAFVAMAGLSVLLFIAGPRRSLNRRLALLLFVVGVDVGTGAAGLLVVDWVVARPDVTHGVRALHFTVDAALPPLYLLFLASAFASPVTRVLARRSVTALLGIAAVAGPAVVVWRMDDVTIGTAPLTALFAYVAGGFLLAFAIALHAFLRADPGAYRARLRTYLLAFGTLDLTWGATFLGAALLLGTGGVGEAVFSHVGNVIYPGGALVFGFLLAYGVLRHQLLGIDVKIKWTLKQSTVAAVFVAVFFVVSELAAAAFSERLGTVVGILTAGALLFAIVPLQHFAQRVADKAMPGVKPVGEMTEDERAEAYRRQLEAAYVDGVVDTSERRILEAAREALEIDGDIALAIEREVMG